MLKVALAVIVVVEVAAELSYRWHQGQRAAAGWWDRVQLREQRRLGETELRFLAARPTTPARRQGGRRP
jgi:hypothetical protein